MAEEKSQQEVQDISNEVINSVGFFLRANPILKDIVEQSHAAVDNTAFIAWVISDINDVEITPPVEVIEEEKEPISSITKGIKQRSADLAKIGLLLPFLFNEQSRSYLASFVKGLMGIENFKAIESSLKTAAVVLTSVFAYKLFKQVTDSVKALVRLSELVGLLFTLTSDADDVVVEKEKKYEQKKERDKAHKKEQHRKRRENKRNRLKWLRRIRQSLNAAKVVAVRTPMTFLAALAAEATIGTVIDLIVNREDRADELEDAAEENDLPIPDDQGITGAEVAETFTRNVVDQLTFGLMDTELGHKIMRFFNLEKPQELQPLVKPPTPPLVLNKRPSGAPESVVRLPGPGETRPPASLPLGSKEAFNYNAPFKIEPVAEPALPGMPLQQGSESIIASKKDNVRQNTVIVNNVDTSSTVIVKQPQPFRYGSTSTVSKSIGQ